MKDIVGVLDVYWDVDGIIKFGFGVVSIGDVYVEVGVMCEMG